MNDKQFKLFLCPLIAKDVIHERLSNAILSVKTYKEENRIFYEL